MNPLSPQISRISRITSGSAGILPAGFGGFPVLMLKRINTGPESPADPQTKNALATLNPNSEVASGGGLAEAAPECARPREQPPASFQPQNSFQQLTHPTLLRPGQPHSANAEI